MADLPSIRTTAPEDVPATLELTRLAFWNLYVPGASEHYLLHVLRRDGLAIPDLDLIAEVGGEVVGNLVTTPAHIESPDGTVTDIVTWGPVAVRPDFQGRGIGTALMFAAIERTRDLGYVAIDLYGYPSLYSRVGFRNAKEFGLSAADGRFPWAHQVLDLKIDGLAGITGRVIETLETVDLPKDAVAAFDTRFPPLEKRVQPSQAEFAEALERYL